MHGTFQAVKFNEDQLTIGIDVGGTNIKYALVNPSGMIMWENTRPTEADKSRQHVINNITSCINECTQKSDRLGSVICAGIGTPGLVDIEQGLVMGGAPQLPEWEDLHLGKILRDLTGIPTFLDNDANMMGYGEFIFGGGQKGKNLIFITIGTGIGGAIILNGELYRGFRYAGSELGCFPMRYKGEDGYWEDFASTAAMVKYFRSRSGVPDSVPVDGKIVLEKFQEGDKLAEDVINEHTRLVGEGVAGYINIFNPESIVIGGGISEAGDFYIEKIRKVAEERAMKDCFEGVNISLAQLGNKAGFLGASHFALSRLHIDHNKKS